MKTAPDNIMPIQCEHDPSKYRVYAMRMGKTMMWEIDYRFTPMVCDAKTTLADAHHVFETQYLRDIGAI